MRRGRAGRYAWLAIALCACEPPSVVAEDAAVDGGADAGRVEACARASDCLSTFCNPARCAPGEPGASADGCLAEPGPCAAGEGCDEATRRCLAADCESSADGDGDGDRRPACGGNDCDDADPRVRSTAIEVCDPEGLDEDCNPETIRGPTDGDADRDDFVAYECFNRRSDGTENHGSDCDDSTPGLGLDTADHCAACGDSCVIACQEGSCESYVQVVAGSTFGCGLTTTGRVLCWGSGPLGDPATPSSSTPVPVLTIDDARQIAAGSSHACAIRSDASVWCWRAGSGPLRVQDRYGNQFGGTPPGSMFGSVEQVRAAGLVTCALVRLTGTRVYCWGDNAFGQLGQHAFGSTTPISDPLSGARWVEEADGAVGVGVGGSHACAVMSDGTVRCWGEGAYVGDGILDHGATCNGRDCTIAITVPGLTGITDVHGTCAWNGRTWCWPWRGTPNERTDLTGATDVEQRCAIDATSSPVCWGDNRWGALGDGTRTERTTAGAVLGITAAVDVTAGTQHACAVDGTGAAWCWGDNRQGQLGDGVDDHMMGGCSDMLAGPTYECSLVPVRVARPM